jgi:hypothetical protein
MLLGKVLACLQKTETIDACLSPCTSINSKCIKDLNIRPKTLKLVPGKNREHSEAIGIGKEFLAAQQLRERMDKRDYMK